MKQCIGLALLGITLALVANIATAAIDPDPAVKKTFDKMLAAIQANDKDAFVAEGTDAVKKGTTKDIMDALSKQLGTRLKKGYEAAYLGQLKQSEHQVHLWKLTFKDGGDDVLVRHVLKDRKVAGFGLQ